MPLKNHLIKHYLTFLIFIVFFLLVFLKTSLIWGEDGSFLWMPIISEFLKGNSHYPASNVIFSGQNLRSIYGEFSFWYLFRFFSLTAVQSLNLTFFIFVSLFCFLLSSLLKILNQSYNEIQNFFIFSIVTFSPIIFNRVYSGHFNLLFAILPFFSFILLILAPNKLNFFVNVICTSTAFGIQGYQVLIYYIFYLPILYFFIKESKNSISLKIFLILFISTFLGLLISIVPFWAMLKHSSGPDVIRSLNSNVVYSYITSTINDLPSLFLVLPGGLNNSRNFGFFHEINYPLSISIFLLFVKDFRFKKTVVITLVIIALLWLFSSNIGPINLLSNLPFIRAFRVPQRSFIIPVFFMHFLFVYYISNYFNLKSFFLFCVITVFLNFLPNFEIPLFVTSFLLLYLIEKFKNDFYKNSIIALSFSLFFLGLSDKILIINRTNFLFETYATFLKKIDDKFFLSKTSEIVHFESYGLDPVALGSAANFLGIRTVEGYGHPTIKSFYTFQDITNTTLPITTNTIYFDRNTPNYLSLLDKFNIKKIISVNSNGEYKIESIK